MTPHIQQCRWWSANLVLVHRKQLYLCLQDLQAQIYKGSALYPTLKFISAGSNKVCICLIFQDFYFCTGRGLLAVGSPTWGYTQFVRIVKCVCEMLIFRFNRLSLPISSHPHILVWFYFVQTFPLGHYFVFTIVDVLQIFENISSPGDWFSCYYWKVEGWYFKLDQENCHPVFLIWWFRWSIHLFIQIQWTYYQTKFRWNWKWILASISTKWLLSLIQAFFFLPTIPKRQL